MKSLKHLYQIGPGPSSSHTLAPQKAAKLFKKRYPSAQKYEAHLYGSLALTGKGHLTDQIIKDVFKPNDCEVFFHQEYLEHPNVFYLKAINHHNKEEMRFTSLGGGALKIETNDQKSINSEGEDIYFEKNLDEIKKYCREKHICFIDYINEKEDLNTYLEKILKQMIKSVDLGIRSDGLLPGNLKLKKSAKKLYEISEKMDNEERSKMLISSYAYAASEQNASGQDVVTAPTMGSAGVMPAIMYYYYNNKGVDKQTLVDALKIGGLFGNIIKHNATISGAKGGCQAEIGAACSMASAAVAFINGLNDKQIEYAAEMGMEHHLGLTCDPVGGYVMIPCIERNAVAALRAIDCAFLSKYLLRIKENKVSFDMIVNTMNYTGNKLVIELKETSLGGLAKVVPYNQKQEH